MTLHTFQIADFWVSAVVKDRQLYAVWVNDSGIYAVRGSMVWAVVESRLFHRGFISHLT